MSTPENKVQYGLENVHCAVITDGDSRTYGTPKALPGGVTLTADPQGTPVRFFADNKSYFSAETNRGYKGSISIAALPDWFKKEVLSYKEDANGALFEDANAQPNKIALLFEFKGDAKKSRHVFYEVNVSRPSVTSKTEGESIEPEVTTFEFEAVPDPNGHPKASIKQGQEGYETFFQSVYQFVAPTLPPSN